MLYDFFILDAFDVKFMYLIKNFNWIDNTQASYNKEFLLVMIFLEQYCICMTFPSGKPWENNVIWYSRWRYVCA